MNRLKIKIFVATLLLLSQFTHRAMAEGLRCGVNLVEIGEVKAEVIEKCGAPITIDSFCRNEYYHGRFGYEAFCHNVDLWTFNFGVGTFLINVEFEEGRVSNISHGDRVK